jgi:hypothetical protein
MELAGTGVRRTGIYNVTHQAHRPTHQAILQTGDTFPVCRICGTAARFDFAQLLTESDEIEHIGYDLDFMESVLQPLPESA